jgi:hypothetical protein
MSCPLAVTIALWFFVDFRCRNFGASGSGDFAKSGRAAAPYPSAYGDYPRDLVLGVGTIAVKYPGQPRVPKGNGRESGQWTFDGASESDGFIAAPEAGAGWELPVMEQMPRLSS